MRLVSGRRFFIRAGVVAGFAVMTSPIFASPNPLTFSGTQKWLPHFLSLANLREKSGALLNLAEPPKNDSSAVKIELDQLVDLQNKRHDRWVRQILIDKDIHNAVFGDFVLDDHEQQLTPVGHLVFALLDQSMGELFAQKKKFDRVRPVFLSQKLKTKNKLRTLFETPFHPSYPSGHSFQAHIIALLLGQIAAEQSDAALCDAARVAIEREMAGVHYASDSAAGAALAKAYMTEWLQRPEVKVFLPEARSWWKKNRRQFLAERAYRKPTLPMEIKGACTLESMRAQILESR